MEVSSIPNISANTRKALERIPRYGLYSAKKRLNVNQVEARIAMFQNQKEGIAAVPSGSRDKVFVRNAVILDLIEGTEKLKMQATLKYLAETAGSNRGKLVPLHYDPLTGQITDYRLRGKDQLLASVGIQTITARETRWAQDVNKRNMEVVFAKDGQISEVTFEIEDAREPKMILESGLTKEQIMVMAGVAKHNKNNWDGKGIIQMPLPEAKRDMVRLGQLAGADNFWNVFANR